jgi:hypothetical protein
MTHRSKVLSAESTDELHRLLWEKKCTDGLPVVLPTPELIDEFLVSAALAGFDPDIVLGVVGPALGEATIEKVAINAAMAGCDPTWFPLVIAAVRALCDPRLDLTEVQVTTHHLAPVVVFGGPAMLEAGVSYGFGALGYGQRVNLTIGRALRLCQINLGGGWPGVSDMALMGQPGMIATCFGEDPESPFGPLHASLGLPESSSAVTIACLTPAQSVICMTNVDDPRSAERLLEALARTIAGVGNNNAVRPKGSVVICLNPDHAAVLKSAGYNREAIQQALWERSGNSDREIRTLRYGLGRFDDLDDSFHHAIESPESVLVTVAGGPGLYSLVFLPWGGGPHGNQHVAVEFSMYDACEVGPMH